MIDNNNYNLQNKNNNFINNNFKFSNLIIKYIFKNLEHNDQKLIGSKRYSTETCINGIHFCNSSSVQVIYLSLVSKEWANFIIPKIEFPWYIANEKDFYYFNKWVNYGICGQYKPISFDFDRVVFQISDDNFIYPSIPVSIKNIYNFKICDLLNYNRISKQLYNKEKQEENNTTSSYSLNSSLSPSSTLNSSLTSTSSSTILNNLTLTESPINNQNLNNIKIYINQLKYLKINLDYQFVFNNNKSKYSSLKKEKIEENEFLLKIIKENDQLEILEFINSIDSIFDLETLNQVLKANKSIKQLKISGGYLYDTSNKIRENSGTTSSVRNMDFDLFQLQSSLFSNLNSLKFLNTNISSEYITFNKNLTVLKLNNSIEFINGIIDKLLGSSSSVSVLKVLSIKEKKIQKQDQLLKSLKRLFEKNSNLEKITLDFRLDSKSEDIIDSGSNGLYFNNSMDLIVSIVSDNLKSLKISSNSNIIIQNAPSLERLIIIDKQLDKLNNKIIYTNNLISLDDQNNNISSNLYNLKHFGYIGKILNQSLNNFILNINNNNNNNKDNNNFTPNINILNPFQILNSKISILNLNNSNNNNFKKLNIKLDNSIYVYDIIQSLSNSSSSFSSTSTYSSSQSLLSNSIEHLEFIFHYSVLYKVNEKKCIKLMGLELIYSILNNQNVKNLKSIKISSNNIERCSCRDPTSNCSLFINQFNLINLIENNNQINFHLPLFLKELFKSQLQNNNNNSIQLLNVCFNRW